MISVSFYFTNESYDHIRAMRYVMVKIYSLVSGRSTWSDSHSYPNSWRDPFKIILRWCIMSSYHFFRLYFNVKNKYLKCQGRVGWTSLIRFCQHLHFNVTDFKSFGRSIRTNETIAWHHLPRSLGNLLMGNWKMIIQMKNAAQARQGILFCPENYSFKQENKWESAKEQYLVKSSPTINWVPRFPG